MLHLIDLWRGYGVGVHLVPMPERWPEERWCDPDPEMRAAMDALGCVTHRFDPGMFAGKIVVSFCCGPFLAALPDVHAAGRPEVVTWANCMTACTAGELAAHKAGLIDLHIFQSAYQRARLVPELKKTRLRVGEMVGYRAYFNRENVVQGIEFSPRVRKLGAPFVVGRLSRDDPSKYPADLWATFGAVVGDGGRTASEGGVRAVLLGWSEAVAHKCGAPPPWAQTHGPGEIPVGGEGGMLDKLRDGCLIHATGGSRENWPRVVLEAYAAGVPVIAERDYGVREMVVDGVTGFLCRPGPGCGADMAERASELAADEPKRQAMIAAGRKHMVALAGPEACWPAWERLFAMHTELGRRRAAEHGAICGACDSAGALSADGLRVNCGEPCLCGNAKSGQKAGWVDLRIKGGCAMRPERKW